ncbi:HPP family protein [Aeromonas diversa]|uniref:HPP family protein n=1 Tax=Aeromonas diversa TaxID=502790 RepID=UPI003F5895FC
MIMAWKEAGVAGIGAALAIGVLGGLDLGLRQAILMAPFGASCVLLFSLPQSPLAQQRNLVGGHLLTACVGLVVQALPLPPEVQMALAVGLGIGLMQGLGLIHPPAGANPLLVLMTGQSWPFLWQTVLPGALLLWLLSRSYHRARQWTISREA